MQNNKNFMNPNFGGNRVTSDLSKINQMKNNNGVVYQKNFSVENYQFQLVILFY